MKRLYAIVLVALLIPGASAACEQATQASDGDSPAGQGFIKREWSWSDGTSTTTFTAYGPPDEVTSLDPQNGIVDCDNCQLASSMQLGLGDTGVAN